MPPTPRRRLLALVALALAVAGHGCRRNDVPPGFARGSGRLEAQQIQVATKLPGRVAQVLVDEGDEVKQGQVLARMDTGTLQADLDAAAARVAESHEHFKQAKAVLDQRESECRLAEHEFRRARQLRQQAVVSEAQIDRLRSQLETARALRDQARARLDDIQTEIRAAEAAATRARKELDDATLVAPHAGRIQYRLAEPGEVLPAGGRVLTLLDMSDVTMTIFLPTAQAGRARVGAEARVVLDADPATPLPARVSFVAREAQFTPKQVETESERQKLAFRVEVRLGDSRGIALNPGTPGVAWVRLDAHAAWPESLRVATAAAAP